MASVASLLAEDRVRLVIGNVGLCNKPSVRTAGGAAREQGATAVLLEDLRGASCRSPSRAR
jgi:hypothetical protein